MSGGDFAGEEVVFTAVDDLRTTVFHMRGQGRGMRPSDCAANKSELRMCKEQMFIKLLTANGYSAILPLTKRTDVYQEMGKRGQYYERIQHLRNRLLCSEEHRITPEHWQEEKKIPDHVQVPFYYIHDHHDRTVHSWIHSTDRTQYIRGAYQNDLHTGAGIFRRYALDYR